jgi:hypothetical protein
MKKNNNIVLFFVLQNIVLLNLFSSIPLFDALNSSVAQCRRYLLLSKFKDRLSYGCRA